jgi:porin
VSGKTKLKRTTTKRTTQGQNPGYQPPLSPIRSKTLIQKQIYLSHTIMLNAAMNILTIVLVVLVGYRASSRRLVGRAGHHLAVVCVGVFLGLSWLCQAGDSMAPISGDAAEAGLDTSTNPPRLSGYQHTGLGGPTTVGAELQQAHERSIALTPVRPFDRLLQPWNDLKSAAHRDLGLTFGLHYTALYQGATSSLQGTNDAASGKLDLSAEWNLLRSPTHPGSLVGRGEWRPRLGTDIPPGALGSEIGAIGTTAYTFSDWGLGIPDLYWRQKFFTNRIELAFGQVDLTDYFDQWLFGNANNAFLNGSFQASPTIALPDQGLGAMVGALPLPQWYVMAGIGDANGEPNQVGFDTFFETAEYFTVIETGFIGSLEERSTKNVHATVWHSDAREAAQVPEGWGVSGSAQWLLGERWIPFLHAGYAHGGATPVKVSVSAGLGVTVRTHDAFGIGWGWNRPHDAGLRDQHDVELFYRFQMTPQFSISPDIQILFNPALNPDHDVIGVFGIRGRLEI